MTQCPECRQMILDDSAYCDRCGKELKWCPECKRPKRGTECPVCGNDLIPGRRYLALLENCGLKQPQTISAAAVPVQPQATAVAPSAATALVGNGWRLTLMEGAFGRVGGLWPELSSCTYVSSNHGRISKSGSQWMITDNGTTNGTFINEVRVSTGATMPINKGDHVRIATLEFIVE